MRYKFCPMCAFHLDVNGGETSTCPKKTQYCPACGFIYWNNPVPVSAVVIPFLAATDLSRERPEGVLVVQRKMPPFPGSWCLPCGFMNKDERPKASARREVFEETGVITRMKQLIALCNPSPEGLELNQITAFYLAEIVESNQVPVAGDDASAVGIYYQKARKIKNLTNDSWCPEGLCFKSHEMVVEGYLADKLGPDFELRYKK